MTKALQACGCIALLALAYALFEAGKAASDLDVAITDMPRLVDLRLAGIEQDMSAHLTAIETKSDAQLTARAADIRAIAQMANERTGQALEITRDTAGKILDPTHGVLAIAERAESDADAQLGLANRTLTNAAQPIANLASRLTLIPDQVSTAIAPSWAAIEPEITDRKDGHGYVGWHSRISGLMGEALNVGGVFTKQFPVFSGSITGISVDVHKFTTKATAPPTWKSRTSDIIFGGAAITRAICATGAC